MRTGQRAAWRPLAAALAVGVSVAALLVLAADRRTADRTDRGDAGLRSPAAEPVTPTAAARPSDVAVTPAPSVSAPTAPNVTPIPSGTPAAPAPTTDPVGDVTDPAGQAPPDPVPAADLRAVTVDRTDGHLLIGWVLAGPPPPAVSGSLLWTLETQMASGRAYQISVQQVGARLFTGVFDWRTGRQQPLTSGPQVAEDRLLLRVPLTAVPDLSGPFRWFALTQLDGAFEDRVPATGTLAG